MPVAAGLASGIPMFVAVGFDRIADGVVGSLAGLVFLYLPTTSLSHRLATLMACAFGAIASFALGVGCHLIPSATVPLITTDAIVATVACRYFRIGPPGSLVFIMMAALAAYMPGSFTEVFFRIGLLAVGCIWVFIVAFIYSIYILSTRAPEHLPPAEPQTATGLIIEPVVIGLLVGLSLAIADTLHMIKPYWVAVSCLAILQGISLRTSWNRQIQRIVGTAIGIGVTAILLPQLTSPLMLGIAITVLMFLIETAVVRYYGFAVIFITPMTILLAEAPALQQGTTRGMIAARFTDTLLGAFIGFIGAALLHSEVFKRVAGRIGGRNFPRTPCG